MAVSTVTLRPNGTIFNLDVTTVPSGSSLHARTSDDSDTTYISFGSVGSTCILDLTNPSAPANKAPTRLRVRKRTRLSGSSPTPPMNGRATLQYSSGGILQEWNTTITSALANHTGAWINPGPHALTQAALDGLRLGLSARLPWGNSTSHISVVEAYVDVQYDDIPTPALVQPADGAVVATGRPTLTSAGVVAPLNNRIKRHWQIADENTFSSPIDVYDTDWLPESPTSAVQLPTGVTLVQGTTYYLRCRVETQNEHYGAWSTTQTFTVSHPPTKPVLQFPVGGAKIATEALPDTDTVGLYLSLSDTWMSDTLAAYEISIVNDTILAFDGTGEVAVPVGYAIGATIEHLLELDSAWIGDKLRWRARGKDLDGVWGAWSEWAGFEIQDQPTLDITDPANSATVVTPTPTFEWTVTPSISGDYQTHYAVAIYLGTHTEPPAGAPVYSSGQVASTVSQHDVTTPVLVPGEDYTVFVAVWMASGLAHKASPTSATTHAAIKYSQFTADFVAPETPLFVIDGTYFETHARIIINWTGAEPDVDFVSWRIYRRNLGDPTWKLIVETTASTYSDYTAPAQTEVEYAVVQVITQFGGLVESSYVAESIGPLPCPNYWLVCPSNPALNVLLPNVVSDTYTDEYDAEELRLIGRGRRIEVGTHYGVNGTLTAQLYGDEDRTPRQQKLQIQNARRAGLPFYLRTPFGDVWAIGMMETTVDRIAGVGDNEMVTVTIGYAEVMD